jgi:glycerophosphoryl diester phosphodiesterase
MSPAIPTLLPVPRTSISAHRGGAGLWPENSREAFRNAAGLGVESVEFDVHRTADGELVVHHDAALGRTSEGVGEIAGMRWADLKRVPLRGAPGEGIPHLDEVLAILGPAPVDLRLEIKQPRPGEIYEGIEAEIVDRLGAAGLLERTTFTSFDTRYLARLRADHAVERLIYLVRSETHEAHGRDVARPCGEARTAGVPELAIRVTQIHPDDRARCEAAGLRFGAFGVNDQPAIDWALAAGMCAFTTDRPDLALAARARFSAQEHSPQPRVAGGAG